MSRQMRPIQQEDNEQVAAMIRSVMTEFGCVGDGYSINDPEVDFLYEKYSRPRHAFWVIEDDGKILGCGGIGLLDGAGGRICELKKMYFYPELRGEGWGRKMVEQCLQTAREFDYEECYIETVDRMESANALYQKLGFQTLGERVGDSGHYGCDAYYSKKV